MLSFIPTPIMQPHWPSRKWKSLPSTTWWQPEGARTFVVSPYATFGTEELSQHALKALEYRKCCLLAHHGVIATGASPGKALWLAGEVETLAKQYLLILSTGREAKQLSGDEIERVRLKMSDYGLKTGKPKEQV